MAESAAAMTGVAAGDGGGRGCAGMIGSGGNAGVKAAAGAGAGGKKWGINGRQQAFRNDVLPRAVAKASRVRAAEIKKGREAVESRCDRRPASARALTTLTWRRDAGWS